MCGESVMSEGSSCERGWGEVGGRGGSGSLLWPVNQTACEVGMPLETGSYGHVT